MSLENRSFFIAAKSAARPWKPTVHVIKPHGTHSPTQKNPCTPMFIAALFTIAKCWKQPRCPSVDEWIKKLWYIYSVEYYAAERSCMDSFETAWVELQTTMPSEISHSVKEKYHMISLIRGI